MKATTFYLIDAASKSFETEAALVEHVQAARVDTAKHIAVSGTAHRLSPQIALLPMGEPAPKRERTPKAPKEPAPEVRAQVMGVFATGAACTKATVRAHLTGYGTDTVDNAIDWLATSGALTREKKTYRAAKASEASSAT